MGEIVIRGEHIEIEKRPPLRAAFEDMTRKLMEYVTRTGGINVPPELVREIRKNVRALGCPLSKD